MDESRFQPKAEIMDGAAIRRALVRIAHEEIESNKGVQNVALVGIRRRRTVGSTPSAQISQIEGKECPVGILDITLYRDDLTTIAHQPVVQNGIPFDVTDMTIVLVDDVLYTAARLERR